MKKKTGPYQTTFDPSKCDTSKLVVGVNQYGHKGLTKASMIESGGFDDNLKEIPFDVIVVSADLLALAEKKSV